MVEIDEVTQHDNEGEVEQGEVGDVYLYYIVYEHYGP